MFVSIGRFAHRGRWIDIVAWFVVFAVSIPFLLRVEEPLKVGGFSSDKTDAARAADVLERVLGFSPSTIVVTFHSDSFVATNAKFGAEVRAALAGVSALPNVTH